MSLARALGVIWTVLTPAQRRRCVLLQFVSALMALSTVAGLAAVMTFLAVLADPLLVDRNAALKWCWQMLGTTKREFLLVLGAGFIMLLVGSALLNVFGARAAGRFFFTAGDRVREVLFGEYLRRDYHFHMRTGTAQLIDNVLYQTDRLTMALLNGQLLITNAVLTLLVITSIAVVSPWVALAGTLLIGGSYFLFFRFIRRRIERNGRLQSRQGAERIAVVEQAFLGIKQVIIARAQPLLSRRFAAVMRTLTQAAADTQFLGQAPRFVLECLAGAALIACAAFVSGGSAGSAWLAQLGFIGFAGFRLLPAIQQMYYALVIVRGQRTAIESLAAQLENREPDTQVPKPRWPARVPALRRGIELAGVSFRYAPGAPLILDEVALRIPAGAVIGIMGVSGCGKTTLVDLILGLLLPTAGRIEIDGVPLDALRVPDWQQCLGYVPQEVMIVDGTVRENIAFGVDAELIDDTRVRQAATQAGAGEFIEALPGGYLAKISGTGRDLSGGQRQRIAIARALYSDPLLLILDEATNSLDPETERAVVEAVIHNRGSRTLVVVAHGAAMLAACDRVYELRGWKLHECAVLRPVEPLARARARGE